MPNPKNLRPGRPHLARDRQQWIFDYIIQQSGMWWHWWSDNTEKAPQGARSHAMFSKYYGRGAQAIESEARAAAEVGNLEEALKLYIKATGRYVQAEHPIFENNGEKLFLYEGVQRCYDKVRELASYQIERIEVPWEGTLVAGWLWRSLVQRL